MTLAYLNKDNDSGHLQIVWKNAIVATNNVQTMAGQPHWACKIVDVYGARHAHIWAVLWRSVPGYTKRPSHFPRCAKGGNRINVQLEIQTSEALYWPNLPCFNIHCVIVFDNGTAICSGVLQRQVVVCVVPVLRLCQSVAWTRNRSPPQHYWSVQSAKSQCTLVLFAHVVPMPISAWA